MLSLFERVLDAFASLKLAIFVIGGLAFFLAVATVYESVYGAPAAQAVVYASPAFFVIMVLLAINVASAVIVRYPFRRKQTGFIVTHIGIELLLLGCLISYRQSSEGVLEMRPGQAVDSIDSTHEGLFVSWDDGKQTRQEAMALDCWNEAGYPSPFRFVGGLVKALPERPTWTGEPVGRFLAPNVRLDVVDWLPAAKFERIAKADPNGSPAVQVRLSGRTPNGMAQDESTWLHQEGSNGAATAMFGGMVEAVLWQARVPADLDAFMNPPAWDKLPANGQISIGVGNVWQRIDVARDLGKTIAVGDTGWRATVEEYFPEANWDGKKLVKASDAPNDPMARVKLDGPGKSADWVVSARYPFLTGVLGGASAGESPAVVFDHPAVFKTDTQGQRGRLQLMQTADGKLYGRRFGIRGIIDQPAEMKVGQEGGGFMTLKMTVLASENSAILVDQYKPANVAPNKMADAMRAAKVRLTVDGQSSETWLARGAGPQQLKTPRGPMTLAYGFDALKLPFQLGLTGARMTRDPGSGNAAAYESDVDVIQNDGNKTSHKITMNEPLTEAGYTFYQSGFDDQGPAGPVTVLRMRRDAGSWPKYAGCFLIVFGIFLMFYMKAYFQPKAALPKTAASSKLMPAAA